ncbi:hypothetical protein P3T73_12190 [Kiritimatiellota bacterium B12222]|nr:hypothetical protein P3T73_12190 [Kiritimatiellota bacterium B12222]
MNDHNADYSNLDGMEFTPADVRARADKRFLIKLQRKEYLASLPYTEGYKCLIPTDLWYEYIDSIFQLSAFIESKSKKWSGPVDICNYPRSHHEPLDFSNSIDRNGFENVAQWVMNPNRKPWLVLYGPTGLGKTRAACMAGVCLDEFSEVFEGASCYRFVRAVDYARCVATAKGSLKPLQMTGFPDSEFDPDIHEEPEYHYDGLILDDLDKMTFTDAVLRSLFDLIDHAEQNRRPVIITTQASGRSLFQTMTGTEPTPQRLALVESIIRRITDHAEIIGFNSKSSDSGS